MGDAEAIAAVGDASPSSDRSTATTLIGREETFGRPEGATRDRISLLLALAAVGAALWYGLPRAGLDPRSGVGLAATCFLLPLASMLLADTISRLLRRH